MFLNVHLAGRLACTIGSAHERSWYTTEAATDPREVLSRPSPPADLTLRYGPGPEHVADLRLPQRAPATPAPLVLFLHGGFWRAAFDRQHTGPLAAALAQAGYAVCVPEFRRTGDGGGWPGTFDDIAAAVNLLPTLAAEAAGPGRIAPGPVILAGHSAGGHLALWAEARHRLPRNSSWYASPGRYRGVVALAPVSNLAACYTEDLDNGAAQALIGGGPADYPERYAQTDPSQLGPPDAPVHLLHGTNDDRVPCQMSHAYTAQAAEQGVPVMFSELDCGHFELIDPLTRIWPIVLAAFRALS